MSHEWRHPGPPCPFHTIGEIAPGVRRGSFALPTLGMLCYSRFEKELLALNQSIHKAKRLVRGSRYYDISTCANLTDRRKLLASWVAVCASACNTGIVTNPCTMSICRFL